MKTFTVYKVLSREGERLTSYNLMPRAAEEKGVSGSSIYYRPHGHWTYPTVKGTPLFAYASSEEAFAVHSSFALSEAGDELWEAATTVHVPFSWDAFLIVSRYGAFEGWEKRWTGWKQLVCPNANIVLCDKIKLIKRIH